MDIHELIQQFEDRVILPVRLTEVRSFVLDNCGLDRIRFIGVDIDPAILRGMFYFHETRPSPYSLPEDYADVLFAEKMDDGWRRLVCCKEMIHVMDHPNARVASQTDFDRLLINLSTPADIRAALQHDGTMRDRTAILQALAILFPFATRAMVLEKYRSGRITPKDVAMRALIPERYVEFLMSDLWATIYPAMAGHPAV